MARNSRIIRQTDGFVDYENLDNRFWCGDFDKGRELVFLLQTAKAEDPVKVRFFISFSEQIANPDCSIDDGQLIREASNIVDGIKDREINAKELLYLYNFSSSEFYLLE